MAPTLGGVFNSESGCGRAGISYSPARESAIASTSLAIECHRVVMHHASFVNVVTVSAVGRKTWLTRGPDAVPINLLNHPILLRPLSNVPTFPPTSIFPILVPLALCLP